MCHRSISDVGTTEAARQNSIQTTENWTVTEKYHDLESVELHLIMGAAGSSFLSDIMTDISCETDGGKLRGKVSVYEETDRQVRRINRVEVDLHVRIPGSNDLCGALKAI